MTTFNCWPLDNTEYTAQPLGAAYSARSRGLLNATDFAATSNGNNTVTFSAGCGCLKMSNYWGVFPCSLTDITLQFSDADGENPRYDMVALVLDKNNNVAGLDIVEGDPAETPTIPTMRRNDSYDEVFLYRVERPVGATSVTAANILDLRANNDYCGLMRDTIDGIDTSVLTAQITQYLADQQTAQDEFWTDNNDTFTAWRENQESTFNAWFDKIKDNLSTDAAGKLQLELLRVMAEMDSRSIYTATMLLDGWTESGGGYTQTANLNGYGVVSADSVFYSGVMTTPTGVQATDEALQDALTIINAGTATLGDGTVTVFVHEKPECDITCKWLICADASEISSAEVSQ